MEINDKLRVEIIDLSHDGLGVAKLEDGFTLFVEGALIGEIVNVEITDLSKNYGFAKTLSIIDKSPYRVKPLCPNFGICGGCDLMHLEYKMQLQYKKKMVEETIKRIGHIENVNFDKLVGMDNPYNYRNKVQMPFGYNKKAIVGYYKKKSHQVIPVDKCYLQPDEITEMVNFIKNVINELGISVYNEQTGKGVIRHVLVRTNAMGEFMVVLVTNTRTLYQADKIVEKLTNRYKSIKSIYQNINLKRNNVILGDFDKLLYGERTIKDTLCGLLFNVSYQSFFQVNKVQTEKLYNIALEYANVNSNTSIIDGYCGVGTISLLLAKNAKSVIGIEVVKEAINNAKENAKLNGITNAKFVVGKVEDLIDKYVNEGIQTIVVDPPRKGLDQKVVEAIINSSIKRIVYVSCNVSTLARDLNLFKIEYELKKTSAVDMFCQTTGVETVCLLERK